MKFIADIGNSQIKIAISEDEKISKIKTFSLRDINLIQHYFTNVCKMEKCSLFYSSVVGSDLEKKFINLASKIFKKVDKFKSTKSFLSVKNAYSTPSKLGSDRWLQIIGAHKMYKQNTMIVSFGSAVSIDYVSSKGIHKGGVLLSGADRYIKCFSDIHNLKAIKLSKVTNAKSKILENNTTKQVAIGYELMISSSINKIYSELNRKSQKKVLMILSGSYAKNISGIVAMNKITEPYFVLKSLALVEKYI
tara:strand:+ start:108 stop:854 length:747 start_codon:yes stop_codon:yes gene_type:complete